MEHLGGCPRVVRGDCGTENGHVRDFQCFLHINHADETLDSYLDGASTANQRIKYWWGFLCKECMEFWISLFADFRDNGYFDGGFLDKILLQSEFNGNYALMLLTGVFGVKSISPSLS